MTMINAPSGGGAATYNGIERAENVEVRLRTHLYGKKIEERDIY